MPPHINYLGHEGDQFLVLCLGKLKFNLSLVLGKKGTVLTILGVVYILDSFAVELVGPNIGKSIIIEVKAA